jgi:hypothetical protein
MAKVVTMKKEGERLVFDTELPYIFSTLANGTYHITIKKASQKRSIPQNDLMWMWLACIERETGTPKDDVYMYYCKKFLMKTISIGSRQERIYNTSSKLSSEEMTEFLNKIQADAAAELGIRLPQPEDRFFEQFYAQFNY